MNIAKDIVKPYYTKVIGCDLETTGVRPWKHGIAEFGAVVTDSDGTIIDQFQAYCNPGDVEYDDGALRVNGLTKEFIQAQRPIKEVIVEFIQFMEKHVQTWNKNARSVVVGNNFGFDTWFLQYAFDQHAPEWAKVTNWMFRRTDEMKGMVRSVFPEQPHMSQDKLGELLGIPNERAHGAIGDIKQMLKIYQKLNEITANRIVLERAHENREKTVDELVETFTKK